MKEIGRAYANLLLTIATYARREGHFADFKEYWITRPPMPMVWTLLQDVLTDRHDCPVVKPLPDLWPKRKQVRAG